MRTGLACDGRTLHLGRRLRSVAQVLLACTALALVASRAVAASRGQAADSDAPPRSDDAYRFTGGQELRLPLKEDRGAVSGAWPGTAGKDWDTALLGVRFELAVEGEALVADTFVEMEAAGHSIRQDVEPDANGLRWLNLSALRSHLTPGTRFFLRGRGTHLADEDARLRLFTSKLDLDGRILVLAPHPDDAEIAAFGLYAHRNATIVTVTSGNAGDPNYRAQIGDQAEQYRLKGTLRAVDSVTVPWQGGIPPQRCFNLGYFDARLYDMHAHPREVVPELYGPNDDVSVYRQANVGRLLPIDSRTSTWEHLVEDLGSILERVEPTLIVAPHPLLDHHSDHQYTTVALAQALARWRKHARLLLYTNHAFRNAYPFGPPGTVMSLSPWSESEVAADAVYSHPVDGELQLRKLFALESMHDLRLSPAEQSECGVSGAERRPDYPRVPEVDYFRRAIRSNELFLVYGPGSLQVLVQTFLERAAQAEEAEKTRKVAPAETEEPEKP